MAEIQVRAARESDLDEIVRHYGPGGGDSPWDPFADLDRLQRIPRPGLLVARVGGRYAGFLYWYDGRKPWYDPTIERYARISDLHVAPAFQGQGVGRALLRSALDGVRTAGISSVYLETDEDNTRARSLYESEGFSLLARMLRFKKSL